MARRIQGGGRGADRHSLAGADFFGDDSDSVLIHTPGDPGDGFGVAGVAVQHRRGQTPPERHPGEAVIGLQPFDTHADASSWSSMPVMLGSSQALGVWAPKRAS